MLSRTEVKGSEYRQTFRTPFLYSDKLTRLLSERTRAQKRMPKHLQLAQSPCVFLSIRNDLVPSLMATIKNAFNAGTRQRAGQCLGGVSVFLAPLFSRIARECLLMLWSCRLLESRGDRDESVSQQRRCPYHTA